MKEQVSRRDFGEGEGDFILKTNTLSLTPSYPHTHNQKKSICPSSRHQHMCVQGLLRIPRSDTELKKHGSGILILAPYMAGDHSLLQDVLLNPGVDSNCLLLPLPPTPPLWVIRADSLFILSSLSASRPQSQPLSSCYHLFDGPRLCFSLGVGCPLL